MPPYNLLEHVQNHQIFLKLTKQGHGLVDHILSVKIIYTCIITYGAKHMKELYFNLN